MKRDPDAAASPCCATCANFYQMGGDDAFFGVCILPLSRPLPGATVAFQRVVSVRHSCLEHQRVVTRTVN